MTVHVHTTTSSPERTRWYRRQLGYLAWLRDLGGLPHPADLVRVSRLRPHDEPLPDWFPFTAAFEEHRRCFPDVHERKRDMAHRLAELDEELADLDADEPGRRHAARHA